MTTVEPIRSIEDLEKIKNAFARKSTVTWFGSKMEVPSFLLYFINSTVVTLACAVLTGIVTILGAFGFSRLRFRLKAKVRGL